MHSSLSWLRDCSDSRSISRLLGLWRLCAPVAFLAMALLYATFSLVSDFEYMLGMKMPQLGYFQRSSELFPFFRERRLAGAWFVINTGDLKDIPLVEAAVATDPYAPDMKLGLMRLLLNAGRKDEYNAVLTQLQKLTPKLRYKVVTIKPPS